MTTAPGTTPTLSPAQRAANERAEAAQAVIAASAAATTTAVPHVRPLLPAGWHAARHQAISGATHTVAIEPPTSLVDATAYLMPRIDDGAAVSGWWVRVHNRRQRIDCS